jgi:hypothetical protein
VVYLSFLLFPNSYTIIFWEFYFLPLKNGKVSSHSAHANGMNEWMNHKSSKLRHVLVTDSMLFIYKDQQGPICKFKQFKNNQKRSLSYICSI